MTATPTSPQPLVSSELAQGHVEGSDHSWLKPILLVLLLGIACPALIYLVIIPSSKVALLQKLFSLDKLGLLLVASIMGIFYIKYLKKMMHNPHWMWIYVLVLFPCINWVSSNLMQNGINLKFNWLNVLIFMLPACFLMKPWLTTAWKKLGFLKCYLAFFALVMGYSFFFNPLLEYPYIEPWANPSARVWVCFYTLGSILVAAFAVFQHDQPMRWWDRFNQIFLWLAAFFCSWFVLGAPLGLFMKNIDGFMRSGGFFEHPNAHSQQLGLTLIYFIGLYLIYSRRGFQPVSRSLILISTSIVAMAFLLALSKGAIAALGLSIVIMLFMGLNIPRLRGTLLRLLLLGTVMLTLGILGYSFLRGVSIWEIIEQRLEDSNSMDWRGIAWHLLWSNTDLLAKPFGQGFMSAHIHLYSYFYRDEARLQLLILPHNAYLNYLMDFGLLGFLYPLTMLALVWQSIKVQAKSIFHQLANIMIMGMTVFFALGISFDETVHINNTSMLYWGLGAMLLAMMVKGEHGVAQEDKVLDKTSVDPDVKIEKQLL